MEEGKSSFRVTAEEIQFIQDNCLKLSDQEIADKLNRDIKTVRKVRSKLGISKGGKHNISKTLQKKIQNKERVNKNVLLITQKQKDETRKEFFTRELKNSLYYDNLRQQFTEDELKFYMEEWASLCLQFEDVLATEKRQIDELIKSEIIANRILRNIQLTEEHIQELQKEVESFREMHDMNLEESQKRDEQLIFLIKSMAAQSAAMTNDYQKNQEARNKLFENLNGRRKDRIDQLKKSGVTFAGIVQALRDRETRAIQGKHMELVKLAKERKMAEFRKPIIFPDGSKSPILLDSQSVLDKENERRILDEDCSLTIDEFKEKEGCNILIIENDIKRMQIFQDLFAKHNIIFANNTINALEKSRAINCDLVCLDYDINLGKSDQFVHEILSKNELESSKFLIHSMNAEGAKLLSDLLIGKRTVEVYAFDKIGEKYAQSGIRSGTK